MASYNTVITNEGAALLASVIANQGTLTFSEMRFSTTDYDGVEATLTVGTFAGVFITAAASASVVDSTTIKVGAQFDNSGIVGDHPLYSVGIVGTDGNTTALIAVCTTTNPDIIRAALTGVSTYAFNVNLAVSSTSDITVTGTTAAVLYYTDIVNTLNSTDATKPLSANMGHTLGEEIDAIVNVYGAKNLLPNNMQSSSGTGYSITVGSDKTVVFDGTVPYNFYQLSTFMLKAGTYILSVSDTATGCMILIDNDNNQRILNTNTSGQFTLNSDTTCKCYLYTNGSSVYSNTTFYPMIRDARIVDPTYQPYVPTNQQLTVNKANRSDLASLNLTGTKNTTGTTIASGTYFYLNGQYCITTQDILNNADFTEGTNYDATSIGGELRTKRAVRAREVILAPGVVAYNGVEKCICTEFSDGSVLVNGLIEITNTWEDTYNHNILFTLPDGVNFANWGASQRWFKFGELSGSGFVNGLCGVYGKDFRMWGQNVTDVKNKSYVVDISW